MKLINIKMQKPDQIFLMKLFYNIVPQLLKLKTKNCLSQKVATHADIKS